MFKKSLLIISLLLITGCATHRLSQPLKPGGHEVHFSMGGPMIDMDGMVIPMPLTYVGYRYGLNDQLTLGLDLPITLLAMNDFSFDVQATYFVQPEIAIQSELMLVWDIEHGVYQFYPLLSSWYSFKLGETFQLMPGLSTMFQVEAPSLIVSPFVTAVKQFGAWDVSLELSYLAPHIKQDYTANFISPGYGAVGIYLGIGRRFK